MVVRSAKIADGGSASGETGDADDEEVELVVIGDGGGSDGPSSKGVCGAAQTSTTISPSALMILIAASARQSHLTPPRTDVCPGAPGATAAAPRNGGATSDTMMADYYKYLKSPYPCAHGGSTSGCTNFGEIVVNPSDLTHIVELLRCSDGLGVVILARAHHWACFISGTTQSGIDRRLVVTSVFF